VLISSWPTKPPVAQEKAFPSQWLVTCWCRGRRFCKHCGEKERVDVLMMMLEVDELDEEGSQKEKEDP
jgi:hypothetical protein